MRPSPGRGVGHPNAGWTYEEIIQSLRAAPDATEYPPVPRTGGLPPAQPLAQALAAMRQSRELQEHQGPADRSGVASDFGQPLAALADALRAELQPALELLQREALTQLTTALEQQLDSLLRLELTPRIRHEMNAMLAQELQGKVRQDMQGQLRAEVAAMVQHRVTEELGGLLPDLQERVRKECLAAVSREALGNGKVRQDIRTAIHEERNDSVRQELLTVLQQELLGIRTELRGREERLVQRQQQRLEALEQVAVPQLVAQQLDRVQQDVAKAWRAEAGEGGGGEGRRRLARLCKPEPMEKDPATPSRSEKDSAPREDDPPSPLQPGPADTTTVPLRAALKRKAPDVSPPPPPPKRAGSDRRDVHYLKWGLLAVAQGLRAGQPLADPELFPLLAAVRPEAWDVAAVGGLVDALVEQEAALRRAGVLALYVEALLPHCHVLPELRRQQLEQLAALHQLYAVAAVGDMCDSQRLSQFVGTLTDLSLKGWKLSLDSLVDVLQKVAVAHQHRALPQRPGPLPCEPLLQLVDSARGTSTLSDIRKAQFKAFHALLSDAEGLSRALNSGSSLERFRDHLQANMSWAVGQAGGSVPAAWLRQFLLPLCVSLLTAEMRGVRSVEEDDTTQRVTKTLVTLFLNREDFSDIDLRCLQAESRDPGSLEDHYLPAIHWLVKECCCLHVEDPTYNTGLVSEVWAKPASTAAPKDPLALASTAAIPDLPPADAQARASPLQEVNHLLQSQSQEVLNFLHRTLTPSRRVNYDEVDWRARLCHQLRSDQLLKFNEGLFRLHEAVTSRFAHLDVHYEVFSLRVKEKRRQEILDQVEQFFNCTRDPFSPREIGVRRISEDDPREGLRGQWGLFCSTAGPGLPEYAVVGPYAGYLRTNKEYSELHTTLAAKMEHDRYCYALTAQPGKEPLIVDAFGVGNQLMLINDCRFQPFVDDTFHRQPNVRFLEVLRNGWPHVFVMTLQRIKPGSELLLDYGPSYWEGHRMLGDQLGSILERHKAAAEALRPLVAGSADQPIRLD